jgi:hypothetical protein
MSVKTAVPAAEIDIEVSSVQEVAYEEKQDWTCWAIKFNKTLIGNRRIASIVPRIVNSFIPMCFSAVTHSSELLDSYQKPSKLSRH